MNISTETSNCKGYFTLQLNFQCWIQKNQCWNTLYPLLSGGLDFMLKCFVYLNLYSLNGTYLYVSEEGPSFSNKRFTAFPLTETIKLCLQMNCTDMTEHTLGTIKTPVRENLVTFQAPCYRLFCLIWFFTSHQGHNTVTPVRLEPAALQSWVKHSTTEPLGSLLVIDDQRKVHLMGHVK